MKKKENGFLKKLLETFRNEAEEHITAISTGLLELEKLPSGETQKQILETIFREAHSLKGSARSVNRRDIEELGQSLESVLAALKNREIDSSHELFDLLCEALDNLLKCTSVPEVEPGSPEESLNRELIGKLETVVRKGSIPVSNASVVTAPVNDRPLPEDKSVSMDTVRISAAKLNSLLQQTEELLSLKMAVSQRKTDLQSIGSMFTQWNNKWAMVFPKVQRYRRELEHGRSSEETDIAEFLDWNTVYIKSLAEKFKKLESAAKNDSYLTNSMVDILLEDMRTVLMLPFSSLLKSFPRIVRELSRDRKKNVELIVRGEDIEIDRRILEEIKEPLIHQLRNCIDHGIESPKERKEKKKPPRGIITISVSRDIRDKVEISISDDGAGIDTEAVKSTAVKKRIISQEEADELSEEESLALIFKSGVTTSSMITNISGRGLGLAILQEKAQKLGGEVFLESKLNRGVKIRILLPLTVATFRGIIVRASTQPFVVPTVNVERVVRVNRDEIKTVENRETIELEGRPVSFVRLKDVLELPAGDNGNNDFPFILSFIVNSEGDRVAFGVDEILSEQEVMVKSLGENLSGLRNISSATILPTGETVPIMNVHDLVKSVEHVAGALKRAAVSPEESKAVKKILVVEDSITTRSLLKNILDSAGYAARTAVDGMDGFHALKVEDDFDLVVSDIFMPRLDGFSLTSKIRNDKKLSELPVILVTALESREDQERGMEVGANAYIVKSRFDQSNLLDTIQRLI